MERGTYLAADVVEDRDHAAHVGDREDRVEELPLLAVVVACDNIMRKRKVIAYMSKVRALTEGSEQSRTEIEPVGSKPSQFG